MNTTRQKTRNFLWVALLATLTLAMSGLALTQEGGDDEGEDEEIEETATGWDLEKLPELYHPSVRAIETEDYEEAVDLLKKLKKEQKK